MEELKKIYHAFLAKTLNLTEAEVASLLYANDDGTEIKPDALAQLIAKDATRVERFKTERQTFFDNGYKKAQKEALTSIEKELKEKFALASDKQGVELVEEIVSTALGKGVQMDEDKVKVHPAFIKEMNTLKAQLKEANATWEKKYNDRETSITKEKTFDSIKSKTRQLIESMKPVMPKDAAKAEKQWQLFLNDLAGYEFSVTDDTISILKEGKVLEDKHGNRINFDAFIKEAAPWEFESGTSKSSAGNDNNGGAGTGATNVTQGKLKYTKDKDGKITITNPPKDKKEYVEAMADESITPELRVAITDAFQAQGVA